MAGAFSVRVRRMAGGQAEDKAQDVQKAFHMPNITIKQENAKDF
jgi:hypothetical protein